MVGLGVQWEVQEEGVYFIENDITFKVPHNKHRIFSIYSITFKRSPSKYSALLRSKHLGERVWTGKGSRSSCRGLIVSKLWQDRYSVTHTLLWPHSLLQGLPVPCGIGFWAGRKTGASSLARIDSTLLVSTLCPPFFMCLSEPLMTGESLNRSSPSKEWLPTFQRLHLDLQSE